MERERESDGKGERRYRQTCDNVWTWLVRWTMNLQYYSSNRKCKRERERESKGKGEQERIRKSKGES